MSYSSPPPFIHHLLHSFSSSFIHFPFSHINSFSSVIHGVDRPASSRLRFSNDFGARKPSPSKVSLVKGAQHPHQAWTNFTQSSNFCCSTLGVLRCRSKNVYESGKGGKKRISPIQKTGSIPNRREQIIVKNFTQSSIFCCGPQQYAGRAALPLLPNLRREEFPSLNKRATFWVFSEKWNGR